MRFPGQKELNERRDSTRTVGPENDRALFARAFHADPESDACDVGGADGSHLDSGRVRRLGAPLAKLTPRSFSPWQSTSFRASPKPSSVRSVLRFSPSASRRPTERFTDDSIGFR